MDRKCIWGVGPQGYGKTKLLKTICHATSGLSVYCPDYTSLTSLFRKLEDLPDVVAIDQWTYTKKGRVHSEGPPHRGQNHARREGQGRGDSRQYDTAYRGGIPELPHGSAVQ